jgi:protein dithiol oxidoreductase (disulfide-forming)
MFVRSLLIGLVLGLPAFQAVAYDEGIEYAAVPTPQPTETDGKVEVLEMFWYGCPHCWHLEPLLEQWLASAPPNVVFRRVPAILGPHWEPLGRAYFAAELMGKAEQLHQPLFEAVQVKRERLTDVESIAKFVATQGVDPEAFKEAYNSFFVDMQVRKSAELARDFGVDGVPALVVDGKYRTSATQAGGNQQALDVVTYLVQQETKEATTPAKSPAAADVPPAETPAPAKP